MICRSVGLDVTELILASKRLHRRREVLLQLKQSGTRAEVPLPCLLAVLTLKCGPLSCRRCPSIHGEGEGAPLFRELARCSGVTALDGDGVGGGADVTPRDMASASSLEMFFSRTRDSRVCTLLIRPIKKFSRGVPHGLACA